MVIVRDIPFASMCEHHMMPFIGHAHVAYIPRDGRITGLSKIARVVEGYAHRLQLQERMTKNIADALVEVLQPQGVLVVIEAEHMCMSIRGIKKTGSANSHFCCARGVPSYQYPDGSFTADQGRSLKEVLWASISCGSRR